MPSCKCLYPVVTCGIASYSQARDATVYTNERQERPQLTADKGACL